MKWSIINKQKLYNGFYKLSAVQLQHELFAGGQSKILRRELIDRGQAVAVLPYDPISDEIVLIEQFRIGAGGAENDP